MMGIAGRAADTIINNKHVLIEASLCTRFRTPKSDCSICADLCPMSAISISENGAEIKGGCRAAASVLLSAQMAF